MISTQSQPQVTLGPGQHSIVLTVEDNDGATHQDTVVVTIPQPNVPPVADAGLDQDNASDPVRLDGTGSYDTDGTVVKYTWRKGSDLLSDESEPELNLGIGQHTITLTVEDDDGATDQDTVVITIPAPPENKRSISVTSDNGTSRSWSISPGDGDDGYLKWHRV